MEHTQTAEIIKVEQPTSEAEGSRLFDAIRTFERRKVNLQKRITQSSGSAGSLSYDRLEIQAIDVALDAIRMQWSKLRNLDDPILALEALVEAAEAGDKPKLAEAIARAREVLEDYE